MGSFYARVLFPNNFLSNQKIDDYNDNILTKHIAVGAVPFIHLCL